MIKLKDLLNELDFGKYPFTDVTSLKNSWTQEHFKQLLDQWKFVEEPNTKDEAKFLKALTRYFKDAKNPISVSDLKQLVSIKSKFPGLLDPASSTIYSKLYRGTSIPIKDVLRYSWSSPSWNLYECSTPITINSKTTRGFTSFSISENTATEFATDNWPTGLDDSEYQDEAGALETINMHLVPAVVSIDISDPNTLFNPEFSELFNIHGNEGEVLYIGNSYKSIKTKIAALDDIFSYVKQWSKGKYDEQWLALADHLKVKLK